jgi:hypothetical protein
MTIERQDICSGVICKKRLKSRCHKTFNHCFSTISSTLKPRLSYFAKMTPESFIPRWLYTVDSPGFIIPAIRLYHRLQAYTINKLVEPRCAYYLILPSLQHSYPYVNSPLICRILLYLPRIAQVYLTYVTVPRFPMLYPFMWGPEAERTLPTAK